MSSMSCLNKLLQFSKWRLSKANKAFIGHLLHDESINFERLTCEWKSLDSSTQWNEGWNYTLGWILIDITFPLCLWIDTCHPSYHQFGNSSSWHQKWSITQQTWCFHHLKIPFSVLNCILHGALILIQITKPESNLRHKL
jgi:hypothetical protein